MNEPQQHTEGHNPEIENDPEVIAEEKKLRIWQLRMDRYTQMAKTVAVILQTFKAEAVSLVSGLGTLVLGWFQLKKWVLTGRAETHALAHDARTHKPKPAAEESAAEAPAGGGIGLGEIGTIGHGAGGGSGQGYGSGAGRLSTDVVVAMTPKPVELPTMMTDPNTYIWMGLVVAFIVSTIKAWIKNRRAKKQAEGGANGN